MSVTDGQILPLHMPLLHALRRVVKIDYLWMSIFIQSLIDDTELEEIQSTAARVKEQIEAGDYDVAYNTWGQVVSLVDIYSNGVDFYNFLVFLESRLPTDKRTLLENGELFVVNLISDLVMF